jgi:hypothetical protein
MPAKASPARQKVNDFISVSPVISPGVKLTCGRADTRLCDECLK